MTKPASESIEWACCHLCCHPIRLRCPLVLQGHRHPPQPSPSYGYYRPAGGHVSHISHISPTFNVDFLYCRGTLALVGRLDKVSGSLEVRKVADSPVLRTKAESVCCLSIPCLALCTLCVHAMPTQEPLLSVLFIHVKCGRPLLRVCGHWYWRLCR